MVLEHRALCGRVMDFESQEVWASGFRHWFIQSLGWSFFGPVVVCQGNERS